MRFPVRGLPMVFLTWLRSFRVADSPAEPMRAQLVSPTVGGGGLGQRVLESVAADGRSPSGSAPFLVAAMVGSETLHTGRHPNDIGLRLPQTASGTAHPG
jgi:hypothetical protein